MKAKEKIKKIIGNRWARTAALAVTAAIVFGWLYSHGISPVWTAVASCVSEEYSGSSTG